RPETMHKAMEVARRREDHLAATRRGRADFRVPEPRRVPATVGAPSANARPTGTFRPPATEVKRLTEDEMARRREKGLCFRCEEKYTPGHRCKQNYLIEFVDLDDEEPMIEVEREAEVEVLDDEAEISFIFEVMECPDLYRVVCAQLQLTGDARLWWNAYWSMRPGEKAGCTWDMFKNLVRDKYYPSYYRAEMERQFLALQQGTRTVDEYEREFTRLA
ncbi:Unknown protein, partial [Striga hermonthica]